MELHHTVPQAWQRFWHPVGVTPDKDGLFDPRTTPICPTGHRSTHVFIVRIMRQLAKQNDVDWARAAAAVKPRGHATEFATAQFALQRFQDAGGNLLALAAAGEWGEA